MNNFSQRTLSGAVYVALVVASILVHPMFFGALFGVITLLAIREFHHLMHSSRLLTVGSMVAGGLFFATMWLIFCSDDAILEWVLGMLGVHLLLMMLLLASELWTQSKNAIANWGNALIAQWMIALPFASMTFILDRSPYVLLALFITIWVNDSGAYCVGSLTAKRKNGNHKMFPRVSPGKSWEGLIGGLVFAVMAGCVFYHIGWYEQPVMAWVLSLIIVAFGTVGDLMESLLKRTIGVKDSGIFMPGHGGVLDRFDSILFAAPATALFLLIFI